MVVDIVHEGDENEKMRMVLSYRIFRRSGHEILARDVSASFSWFYTKDLDNLFKYSKIVKHHFDIIVEFLR